jgi:hypothetical protein
MESNVGTADRIARVLISFILVAIAALSDGLPIKLALCFTAWGIFSSGLFGVCLLYKLLRVSTAPHVTPSH